MSIYWLYGMDELPDYLGLHAYDDGSSWNGFPTPIATAAEFKRFISEWRANDPNGTWNPNGIAVVGRFLVYDDGEYDDLQSWQQVDTDDDGNPVYALSGWTWAMEESE